MPSGCLLRQQAAVPSFFRAQPSLGLWLSWGTVSRSLSRPTARLLAPPRPVRAIRAHSCAPTSSCHRAAIFQACPALRAPGSPARLTAHGHTGRCGCKHYCHPFPGTTIPPPHAISGPLLLISPSSRPPAMLLAPLSPLRRLAPPFLHPYKLMPPCCHFPSLPGAEGARALPRV